MADNSSLQDDELYLPRSELADFVIILVTESQEVAQCQWVPVVF